MKKNILIIVIVFVIIIVSLVLVISKLQQKTLNVSKQNDKGLLSSLTNKVSNIINPNFIDNVGIVNQNPKINVAINSTDKAKKFVSDRFKNIIKLTLIISGDPFAIGINDYYKNPDNSQTFFGGSSANVYGDSPTINLAVNVDVVRKSGWDEDKIAKYLEGKLYSSVFNAQQTVNADDAAKSYYNEMYKSNSTNLFKVNYVK